VKSGGQTRFWEDVWLEQVPLKLTFPKLYKICTKRNILVNECFEQGEWIIKFRRPFGQVEVYQWRSLIEKLGGVRLQVGLDESYWCLEKKRHYTTKSMYRFLAHRGVINTHMRRLWKTKLPMKLKVFMWQVFHDKLQTGEELKKRNWKGDGKCSICVDREHGSYFLLMPSC
jgi:hypothetical protein